MNILKVALERLYNGIIKENPTFVLMLGMCPTLAVTTSCINGVGMGLTTMVVLALSNTIISLMRKIIPDKVRVPAYIVIVASFVTIMQFMLEAYLPSLNESLGIYIPLIVVNCIILGRAEAYASKNKASPSLFDGIGMGLGFTLGLGLLGAFREILGYGTILGYDIMKPVNKLVDMITERSSFDLEPITIIGLAPGAFFVLAFLVAIQNKIKASSAKKKQSDGKEDNTKEECTGNCTMCKGGHC